MLRDTTERPEGIGAGVLELVGTDEEAVYSRARALLTDEELYRRMSQASNPYGDGKVSERIVQAIKHYFGLTEAKPEPFQP
ncbi:UDP-N-acetylglucosamine 2-epimerase [compost metagenome]